MLDLGITIVLSNFSFFMIICAAFFMLINLIATRGRVSCYEIIFRWLMLFGIGFSGIYCFILHAYFPLLAAATVGWVDSPFQFEVAVANLSYGILGVCAFRATSSFRLAVVVGSGIWLWGDAVGHLYQIIKFGNFSTGNAGTWFWMDIIVPLILVLCIRKIRKQVPPAVPRQYPR